MAEDKKEAAAQEKPAKENTAAAQKKATQEKDTAAKEKVSAQEKATSLEATAALENQDRRKADTAVEYNQEATQTANRKEIKMTDQQLKRQQEESGSDDQESGEEEEITESAEEPKGRVSHNNNGKDLQLTREGMTAQSSGQQREWRESEKNNSTYPTSQTDIIMRSEPYERPSCHVCAEPLSWGEENHLY
jgi:hypothetical protein